jgi:hypothetical protein
MCTMSVDLDLAGKFPAIRRIVLDGALEALPAGMSLGMTAYFHKDSRFAGPSVQVSLAEGTWKLEMEIAHRPLAVLMVIAGTAPNPHVCDISDFTLIAPDVQQDIGGRIAIGFGHTALPGDYRTRAMIEAEAGAAPTP